MKIKKIRLSNFRGYRNVTEIDFNNLTVFVGRNDIGKSTVLEALDLFFNEGKGIIKYDKADINIESQAREFTIEVIFCELPDEIVVDTTYRTSLQDEYMLNSDGELDIIKKFNGAKCTGTYIRAYHPTNENCATLITKKISELRKIIRDNSIECDTQSTNAVMRRAIWKFYEDDLNLQMVDLDITVGEDTKRVWAKLSTFLPVYFLFQSDRANNDGDKEVQDPLKAAVAQFL